MIRAGFLALGLGVCTSSAWAQLFNNGPLATTPGTSTNCLPTGATPSEVQEGNTVAGWSCSQTAVLGGFHLADDFVVPAGQTWRVTGFRFRLYSIGSSTANVNNVWVQLRNGPPNTAGAVIAGNMSTNRIAGVSSFTNIYRFLNAACSTSRRVQDVQASLCATLPAGTYWVEWSAGGGSSGPWAPPVTLPGQMGKPGANALQLTDFGWEAAKDPGSEAAQDFVFYVEGTTCYPDCNRDGQLTVVDFGCFQTLFVQGNCYSDCNSDGNINVADFGCFQTKFVTGCP